MSVSWSWGEYAPSEARRCGAARLELAALAGLLSPAQKLPDGKSRPAAGISGSWCPHGGPLAGHSETATAGHHLSSETAQGHTW